MTGRRIHLRLAAVYGALALLVGVGLLGALLVTADAVIRHQGVDVSGVLGEPPEDATEQQVITAKRRAGAVEEQIRDQYRSAVRETLLRRGALGVAGLTAGALVLGWYVAGAAMRPLRTITASTRRIADRNLYERIELPGRRDEWGELAASINAMLGKLEGVFTAQRQFVGNASHELKTPLAITRTLLEVATARPDASPDLLRLAENLLAVNARHEELVDGMLALARADHHTVAAHPLNLGEIVGDVIDFLKPEADTHRVRVDRAVDAVVVEGDAVLLDRLVQNLVQNAIRHNVSDGWVRIELTGAAGQARLVVANSGPVVAPAAVSRLFDPFARATNRVHSVRGTGLGLSIARAVVTAHDGTIVAHARPDGGLIVEVTLASVDVEA